MGPRFNSCSLRNREFLEGNPVVLSQIEAAKGDLPLATAPCIRLALGEASRQARGIRWAGINAYNARQTTLDRQGGFREPSLTFKNVARGQNAVEPNHYAVVALDAAGRELRGWDFKLLTGPRHLRTNSAKDIRGWKFWPRTRMRGHWVGWFRPPLRPMDETLEAELTPASHAVSEQVTHRDLRHQRWRDATTTNSSLEGRPDESDSSYSASERFLGKLQPGVRVGLLAGPSPRARLVLLYVAEPPTRLAAKQGPGFCGLDLTRFKHALECLEPRDPDIAVERRVLQGEAARVILAVAGQTKCDLIVMGTHGRIGMRRVLMGSVAEQIVRHAPCPVMTVKTPAHGPQPAGQPHATAAEPDAATALTRKISLAVRVPRKRSISPAKVAVGTGANDLIGFLSAACGRANPRGATNPGLPWLRSFRRTRIGRRLGRLGQLRLDFFHSRQGRF